jgi:transposase InsO family protein
VKRYLSSTNEYTLYKQSRRRYKRIPIYAHHIDQQWQADLADMQKLAKANQGYKYILTVVDTLSKFAFAEPIKSKTGVDVANAFDKILKRAKPRTPQRLQTDKGKEFYNPQFKKLCEDNQIHHFSSESDQKAAGAERWNRTIKGLLYPYMRYKSSENWVKVLPSFVSSYNATVHSRTKMTPNDAVRIKNDKDKVAQLFTRYYGANATKGPTKKPSVSRQKLLNVGQMVRLNKVKGPFVKGYWGSWTLEHFRIREIVDRNLIPVYKLEDYNGEPVKGIFYREELEPISSNTYYIEKILKKRGNEIFVKWLGWGPEFNSWIPKSNITNSKSSSD